MKKKSGATRIKPKNHAPSLLERLGVKTIESFWHGEVSVVRAIQAASLALAVGYMASGAEPAKPPYETLAQYSMQPASLALVNPEGHAGPVEPMTLLIEADASPVYVHAWDVQLHPQFHSKLLTELDKTLHLAEQTGHWDNALASRVSRLLTSEFPLDRQVGNAVTHFIADHQFTAFAEIPHPSNYIRDHAAEIEGTRQTFALVDATRDAVIRSGQTLNERSLMTILEGAGLDGEQMIALFGVQSQSFSQERSAAEQMVQGVRDNENLRVSLQMIAGDYLDKPELRQAASLAAETMARQFGVGHIACDSAADARAAEADRDAMRSPDGAQPLSSIVQSRIALNGLNPIAGRGVLAEDLGVDDDYRAKLPEHRLQPESASLRTANLDWPAEDDSYDFRASM